MSKQKKLAESVGSMLSVYVSIYLSISGICLFLISMSVYLYLYVGLYICMYLALVVFVPVYTLPQSVFMQGILIGYIYDSEPISTDLCVSTA